MSTGEKLLTPSFTSSTVVVLGGCYRMSFQRGKRSITTFDVGALQEDGKQCLNGHKITDWAKFREFAKVHGDKTQAEIAQLWDGEISARTVSRALKKISFTRK